MRTTIDSRETKLMGKSNESTTTARDGSHLIPFLLLIQRYFFVIAEDERSQMDESR